MFNITESKEKVTAAKRTIKLENISVENLTFIDADTGEDMSKEVIDAIPFEKINFKITFDIPELPTSNEESE